MNKFDRILYIDMNILFSTLLCLKVVQRGYIGRANWVPTLGIQTVVDNSPGHSCEQCNSVGNMCGSCYISFDCADSLAEDSTRELMSSTSASVNRPSHPWLAFLRMVSAFCIDDVEVPI